MFFALNTDFLMCIQVEYIAYVVVFFIYIFCLLFFLVIYYPTPLICRSEGANVDSVGRGLQAE